MEQKDIVMLKKVLNDNKRWPLIISGATTTAVKIQFGLVNKNKGTNCLVLAADMGEDELHRTPWLKNIENKNCLIIDGLDQVSPEAQKKFISLLKDRRAAGGKVPAEMQIIIPVQSLNKVTPEIKSLSIIWEI